MTDSPKNYCVQLINKCSKSVCSYLFVCMHVCTCASVCVCVSVYECVSLRLLLVLDSKSGEQVEGAQPRTTGSA